MTARRLSDTDLDGSDLVGVGLDEFGELHEDAATLGGVDPLSPGGLVGCMIAARKGGRGKVASE